MQILFEVFMLPFLPFGWNPNKIWEDKWVVDKHHRYNRIRAKWEKKHTWMPKQKRHRCDFKFTHKILNHNCITLLSWILFLAQRWSWNLFFFVVVVSWFVAFFRNWIRWMSYRPCGKHIKLMSNEYLIQLRVCFSDGLRNINGGNNWWSCAVSDGNSCHHFKNHFDVTACYGFGVFFFSLGIYSELKLL